MMWYSPVYFTKDLNLTGSILLEHINYFHLEKFATEKEAKDVAQRYLAQSFLKERVAADRKELVQSLKNACLIQYCCCSKEKEMCLFECVLLDQSKRFDFYSPIFLEIQEDGSVIEKQAVPQVQTVASAPSQKK